MKYFATILVALLLLSCQQSESDPDYYPCPISLTVVQPTLEITFVNQAGDSLVGAGAMINPDSILYEHEGAWVGFRPVDYFASTRAISLRLDYQVKQVLRIHFPDGEIATVEVIMKPLGPCWFDREIAGVLYNNRLLQFTRGDTYARAHITAIK